ncbi:uncharacterized protein TNCV_158001 [Trichonephila clavipes]|nr:uncharacterized protein TNCV_158001 [Trichonephila clavipes]
MLKRNDWTCPSTAQGLFDVPYRFVLFRSSSNSVTWHLQCLQGGPSIFIRRAGVWTHISRLRPVAASCHARDTPFVFKDLETCTYAMLRDDSIRGALQPPYSVLYRTLKRIGKIFVLCIGTKEVRVSVDRIKPAYFLADDPPSSGPSVPTPAVAAVAEWYRYRIVACHVTSSSPVTLKTRRVGQRCKLLSRAETSSRWCGVVVRRGGASSGVVHVT